MQNINFFQNISLETVADLLEELRRNGDQQRVWIKSNGGTFEFFSVLAPQLLRQDFTSVGCGVYSAAIVLYLLGRKRFVLPDGIFFFHEVRAISETGEVITICDLETAIEWEREQARSLRRELFEEVCRNMRNAQGWMLEFISRQTGTSRPTLLNLMRTEAVLSAREVVHYGLADRIVSADELYNNPRL